MIRREPYFHQGCLVKPGFCDTGNPPCDKPARLYGGGWKCEEHKPKSYWKVKDGSPEEAVSDLRSGPQGERGGPQVL